MDEGYRYRVPPRLENRISVGSLVRVPLGGRKVRGFVVESGALPPAPPDALFPAAAPARPLKDVAAALGEQPVFTPAMLPALRGTARRYLAPLSAALATPPPPTFPAAPPLPPSPPSPPPPPRFPKRAGRRPPGVSIPPCNCWRAGTGRA